MTKDEKLTEAFANLKKDLASPATEPPLAPSNCSRLAAIRKAETAIDELTGDIIDQRISGIRATYIQDLIAGYCELKRSSSANGRSEPPAPENKL